MPTKQINAVKYIADATQKDSQSVCGRVVACETHIKELRKQMQPDVLCETIVTKRENKLKDEINSALQLMTARQDDKLKQEMDSVLETVKKTQQVQTYIGEGQAGCGGRKTA